MRKYLARAMHALFTGVNFDYPSLIVRQQGESYRNGDGPALPTAYSYGPHFPLVILSLDKRAAYLNWDRYSNTTSRQQSECAFDLHQRGYRDAEQTITHKGHDFKVYRKAA